jgi:hypothetical protein
MKFYNDIQALVGNTPLVRVNHITRQHNIKAQVFAKSFSKSPKTAWCFRPRNSVCTLMTQSVAN